MIDLTESVQDGELTWDVPEGNWKVLRIGYSLTGHRNGPAPDEATGLEVDKLDPDALTRYFHRYLDMYKDATGGLIGERGISYLLTDSYEAGCQNWTPAMISAFRERRGYDLVPWLPVLTGEIVESVEKSEAFLWDWSVTIAELYTQSYNHIDDILKEYGMKGRYSESHECGRAYVADGMDIKRCSAVPMAACWIDAGSATMAATDIRESASVAHIYGQNLVAAESLTAHGTDVNAYKYSPGTLKGTADWEMANGLNRFVIHESAHQPLGLYALVDHLRDHALLNRRQLVDTASEGCGRHALNLAGQLIKHPFAVFIAEILGDLSSGDPCFSTDSRSVGVDIRA